MACGVFNNFSKKKSQQFLCKKKVMQRLLTLSVHANLIPFNSVERVSDRIYVVVNKCVIASRTRSEF